MPPFSEADTRANLIDPILLQKGWVFPYLKREESGKAVEIINGQPRQRAIVYVDYTLRVEVNTQTQPVTVALIEAKAENLSPSHGLEQVKAYARCKRFNVPFIFSSNGHQFVQYDRYTGLTSHPRPMVEFPTRTELRACYELKVGFSLEDPVARPLIIPYTGGEAGRRYYQDAALRAVLEKIARCEKSGEPKRALLSLATGAGKTFIAVNLLKKIADAGQLRRALFVCDRDELRGQAHTALQNMFGADAAEVYRRNDGTNNAQNARIHVATYQTLDIATEEGTANFLTSYYPPDYFSHIVIDECHRSAWGKWSQVLTRNPSAVQIGLTATPRCLKLKENTPEAEADAKITADNLQHFGEPVYEYDLAQGIEDGYLAACEILKSKVDLDDTGISIDDVLAHHPLDARTGQSVTREQLEELYEKTDYEDRIQLPDRVMAMCADLFQYLLKTGEPEQKTVIFCVRDTHAEAVATDMNNLYARWCEQNSHWRDDPKRKVLDMIKAKEGIEIPYSVKMKPEVLRDYLDAGQTSLYMGLYKGKRNAFGLKVMVISFLVYFGIGVVLSLLDPGKLLTSIQFPVHETASNTLAAPTPLKPVVVISTATRMQLPTSRPKPTIDPRSGCTHWSKITSRDYGETVCIYGNVVQIYQFDEYCSLGIRFSYEPNTLLIVVSGQNFRMGSKTGQCNYSAFGIVISYFSPTPPRPNCVLVKGEISYNLA